MGSSASFHLPRFPATSPKAVVLRDASIRLPVRRSLGESECSMKISEDVRQYAAEQCIAQEEALAKGM